VGRASYTFAYCFDFAEAARVRWLQQLAHTLSIVCGLPRLRHTTYSELSQLASRSAISHMAECYEDLIPLLPAHVLRAAYDMVWRQLSEAESYTNSWLTYQALWDLDATVAVSRLDKDVNQWLQVLQQLQESRAVFDTVETQKTFGPIVIDFAKVQHGVTVKYDAWHKQLLAAFADMLSSTATDMIEKLREARGKLEKDYAQKETSDTVTFVTLMQHLKKNKEIWSSEIQAFNAGERTLLRNKHKLSSDWVYAAHIEGEWMAFAQIFAKKDAVLAQEMPALQSRVVEEEREAADKIKVLLAEWAADKPLSGDLAPSAALRLVSLFQARACELREHLGNVAQAKAALGMESLVNTDKIASTASEMTDLKEVWTALEQPWEQLQECAETPWNALVPRKVRATLDQILVYLRQLPAMTRQYAAYEHMQELVKSHIKSCMLVTDLRSTAIKERHWDTLATRLSVRWNLSDMTLGTLWAVGLQSHEDVFRDVIGIAQGEQGLEEFLKSVREYWSACMLDLVNYKQHNVPLIRGWDDVFTKLAEHVGSLASMRNSPYYKVFEEDANAWEERLNRTRDLLDTWAHLQRRWVYLEGIFLGSADIQFQLPTEHARFKVVHTDFVTLMRTVAKKPLLLEIVSRADLAATLSRLDDLLTRIQRSLSDYLEQKRSTFPRFYFVSATDTTLGHLSCSNISLQHCPRDIALLHEHGCEKIPGFSW
jgi:dynein heavy chain 1